jgi:hypothetical protein
MTGEGNNRGGGNVGGAFSSGLRVVWLLAIPEDLFSQLSRTGSVKLLWGFTVGFLGGICCILDGPATALPTESPSNFDIRISAGTPPSPFHSPFPGFLPTIFAFPSRFLSFLFIIASLLAAASGCRWDNGTSSSSDSEDDITSPSNHPPLCLSLPFLSRLFSLELSPLHVLPLDCDVRPLAIPADFVVEDL